MRTTRISVSACQMGHSSEAIRTRCLCHPLSQPGSVATPDAGAGHTRLACPPTHVAIAIVPMRARKNFLVARAPTVLLMSGPVVVVCRPRVSPWGWGPSIATCGTHEWPWSTHSIPSRSKQPGARLQRTHNIRDNLHCRNLMPWSCTRNENWKS